MRRNATVAAVLLLALVVGAGPARAAPPSAVALPTRATLLADGSVQLTIKVRCGSQQQAFEWSVDVRQVTTFGGDSAGPVAALVPCDGRFHAVDALVTGANGPFTAGTAQVQALVQVSDAGTGTDVELEDSGTLRVRG